jgi:hypothetical protein
MDFFHKFLASTNFMAFILYILIGIFIYFKNRISLVSKVYSVYFISVGLGLFSIGMYELFPVSSVFELRLIFYFALTFGLLANICIVIGTRALTQKPDQIHNMKIYILILALSLLLFLMEPYNVTHNVETRFDSYTVFYAILITTVLWFPILYSLYLLHDPDIIMTEKRKKWLKRFKIAFAINLIFPITNAFSNLDPSLSFLEFGELAFLVSSVIIVTTLPSGKDWFYDEVKIRMFDLVPAEELVHIWKKFDVWKEKIQFLNNKPHNLDNISIRDYLKDLRQLDME